MFKLNTELHVKVQLDYSTKKSAIRHWTVQNYAIWPNWHILLIITSVTVIILKIIFKLYLIILN